MKRIGLLLGSAVVRLSRGVSTRFLTFWGRWRLFRGDADGAARALESAARRNPSAFGPLVHLARACLRQNDVLRARRALARAREASPGRFRREAETWMRREGYDVAALTDLGIGGRSDVRPAQAAPERQTAVLPTPPAPRRRETAGHPYGDCRNLDEYARFSAMPPISRAEIEGMDWDEVADDLQDG